MTVSQVVGVLSALLLGHVLGLEINGYLIGYAIGVLISFGATLG